MDVTPIQSVGPLSTALPAARPAATAEGFGKALTDAVQRLDEVQREADSQGLQLAAGMPVDLHDVMIAQDKAALGLDLAIQVRNKLVESYQEIMRLQI